jgi:hypothetical protein
MMNPDESGSLRPPVIMLANRSDVRFAPLTADDSARFAARTRCRTRCRHGKRNDQEINQDWSYFARIPNIVLRKFYYLTNELR